MSNVTEQYRKHLILFGFGLRYVEAITDENEKIKGCSLYLFSKQFITIALAESDWVDKNGEPYKFKIDERVLYIKKMAIGFSN